jgi:hypothetical protein
MPATKQVDGRITYEKEIDDRQQDSR